MKERRYTLWFKHLSGKKDLLLMGVGRTETIFKISEITGYETSTVNKRLRRMPGIEVQLFWRDTIITINEGGQTE